MSLSLCVCRQSPSALVRSPLFPWQLLSEGETCPPQFHHQPSLASSSPKETLLLPRTARPVALTPRNALTHFTQQRKISPSNLPFPLTAPTTKLAHPTGSLRPALCTFPPLHRALSTTLSHSPPGFHSLLELLPFLFFLHCLSLFLPWPLFSSPSSAL